VAKKLKIARKHPDEIYVVISKCLCFIYLAWESQWEYFGSRSFSFSHSWKIVVGTGIREWKQPFAEL
jgi:hypothetical protein